MDIVRLHATCVAIGSRGILILGESGMGKSDLALRLIDRGAKLVADDQVELVRKARHIEASAPLRIRALLEVRGVGIFKVKVKKKVSVSLVVQLMSQEWIERLPYPEPYACMGIPVPQVRLSSFESSAAIKVEMAAGALKNGSMTVGALKE